MRTTCNPRPYPVPESDATLYDVVSHEGFHDVDPHPDWDWGAPKHRWRLYSQMLFQAHVIQHSLCRLGISGYLKHLHRFQMVPKKQNKSGQTAGA